MTEGAAAALPYPVSDPQCPRNILTYYGLDWGPWQPPKYRDLWPWPETFPHICPSHLLLGRSPTINLGVPVAKSSPLSSELKDLAGLHAAPWERVAGRLPGHPAGSARFQGTAAAPMPIPTPVTNRKTPRSASTITLGVPGSLSRASYRSSSQ